MCAMVPRWRSEDNVVELVLSFCLYIGLRIELRSPGLCSKCFYLLSHLIRPDGFSKKFKSDLNYGMEKRLFFKYLVIYCDLCLHGYLLL